MATEHLKKMGVEIAAAGAPSSEPAPTNEQGAFLNKVKDYARESPDLLESPGSDGADTLLAEAAGRGWLESVKFLIASGVDVNAFEGDGHVPPLAVAAKYGHLKVAEPLISGGADRNSLAMALMVAAEKGHSKFVDLLLKNGADADAYDGGALWSR